MSDNLLCCFYYNRQSTGSRHNSSSKFPLRGIDKSMIGLPTNFEHRAHIGCSDLAPSGDVIAQSNIMSLGNVSDDPSTPKSNNQSPILAHMKLIDLRAC